MKQLPFWKRPYWAKRILDIGAGHNPFKGVTHVLELHVNEGRERGGNKLVLPRSAALIAGEAMALPFETAAFDYIYASHVLEHVDSPAVACKEIMRVGSAGYIETPSPFLEQGLALKNEESPESWFHKWFVFSIDRQSLVFEPKSLESVSQFCSCPHGQFIREFYASVDFRAAQHCLRRSAKTTIFHWQSSFRVEVRGQTLDCRKDRGVCRFTGMSRMLLASCSDILRAPRLLKLKKHFPACRNVFRKYGQRALFIP